MTLRPAERLPRWNCVSANLSIGTASVFVLVVAGLSLALDKPPAAAFGSGWVLRGSSAPGQTRLSNWPARAVAHGPRGLSGHST